jgi:hypothetical protein
MRLNDASGVPHHPGRISAPVRAGEARPYSYGPQARGVRRKRHVSCLVPSIPLPPPDFRSQSARACSTCVLTMPAASVRAFRKFSDRLGISAFAELRSGRGVRSRGRKLVPALPNRALFENRSPRAQPLKTGRRAILKIEVVRRANTVSASHEAAGRLTREPPRPPDRSLFFCERARKPCWFLKSPGARGNASAPVRGGS